MSNNEFFGFDRPTAQKILQAARKVLNGGELGGGVSAAPTGSNQCITALLTSQLSTGKYAWTQKRRTATGWESVANALSDQSGKFPAYDLNASSSIDLSAADGTKYVVLARGTVNDSGIKPCWHIVGTTAATIDIRLSGGFIQLSTDGGATWVDKIQVDNCVSGG